MVNKNHRNSKMKNEKISQSDSKRLLANGGLYLIEPRLKLKKKKNNTVKLTLDHLKK